VNVRSLRLFAPGSAGALALLLASGPVSGQLAEQSRPPLGSPLGVPVEADSAPGRARPAVLPLETDFAAAQLRHDRVMAARLEARFAIKKLFRDAGLRYPAEQIYMRIFKRERILELWVLPAAGAKFALLKTYDICALAGELGPKRRQGDNQVPEGFYYVDWFNPRSDYLLSLHVDYPNRSDQVLGETGNLGGDIFIHGGCNSEGCLAVTDEQIQELYWIAVEARGTGQQRIPVHIFPARLTDSDLPRLTNAFSSRPGVVSLWRSMKPGFDYFEREHRIPLMSVAQNGFYRFAGEDRGQMAPPARPGAPLGQPLGAAVEAGGTPAEIGAGASAPGSSPIGEPLGARVRTPAEKTPPLGKPAG
jgi:murein L,D-transpeptidase YafK